MASHLPSATCRTAPTHRWLTYLSHMCNYFHIRERITHGHATFTAAVTYRDPKAALDWLERAFGFEVTMAIEGPDDARACATTRWAATGGGGS